MRSSTHLLFGLLISAAALEHFSFERPLLAIGLILLGSLLPDIDEKHSRLGRYVPLVQFFAGHRGFFHGILFLTAASIALLVILPTPYVIAFAIAFLSHLLLDALTPMGVRPFWPSPLRIRGFVRVGGVLEHLIFIAAAIAFIWLLL